MVTIFSPVLLRAALIRRGVWLVDAKTSMPTDFYHKVCFAGIPRIEPQLTLH